MPRSDQGRSKAECIHALQEAAANLGESPSKAEYEALDQTPAASTIIRVCGGWNAAKELAELETNPSTGSRIKSKPESVTLPDGTDWAALSANQRWYSTHRQADIAEKRQRRTDLHAWLYDYKRQADCQRCDEARAACLEFHHQPGEMKVMNVGEMISYGYGKASLLDEIEKCKVLCANCHRKEHVDRPAGFSGPTVWRVRADVRAGRAVPDTSTLSKEQYLRGWTAAYKQIRGCRRCGIDESRCLQFHHDDPDTKTAGVGEMITNCRSAAAITAEVDLCTVLCANCHRQEHYVVPPTQAERE